MQETNLSLSQIILLSDGYSICEVWDDPYSYHPKGCSLKELWPLCTWRLEESIFFQFFTALLPYVANSTNLFAKEKQPCYFLSYSTSDWSCSGLFLGKRTCFFSKAIIPWNNHSSITVLPWLDPFGNTEMWKGALCIPWWWAGLKTLR